MTGIVKIEIDFRASQSLALEGLAADIRRQVQVARKKQALAIDQRALVVISGDQYVTAAVKTNDMSDLFVSSLEILKGEAYFTIDGAKHPLKVNHTRCNVKDGEIYFHGEGDYVHYWDALQVVMNSKSAILST